jgi:hemerythrin
MYESHVDQHRKLLEKFGQITMEMDLGDRSIKEFLEFLMDWFVNHTANEDKKIADYIEKGKST